MQFGLSALPLGATIVLLGCTHVIRVPTECGPPAEPTGRSAIGWERIPGAARVTGRVVSPSLSPIESATIGLVRLSVPPAREAQAYSNAAGNFSFESTHRDRYLMRVRRLGYALTSDTIELTADSGVVATVVLAQHRLTLDECSLTYTEKRVPWWKH
jgi:hypothetical protein